MAGLTVKILLPEGQTISWYVQRETLGHNYDIILKGEGIVILCLYSDMKKRIHSAHLGYDSMMRRARGGIFGPAMPHDIILKGEGIVILCLYSDMKKRIHSAHLGYDSMMRRARGGIFGPAMPHDIDQQVDCISSRN